ncbi:MAG TPA: hypothetical protein VF201_10565 [Nitrolancea sp.]
MSVPTGQPWPLAEIDPVRRLRVLSAAVPGIAIVERIIPLPFETVWTVASDLEHELPRPGGHIRSFQIVQTDGDRFEALVRGQGGLPDRFAGVLRPGWCWMQGRRIVAGMAAVPVAEGTLFAIAGGLRLPGAALLLPFTERSVVNLLNRLERRFWEREHGGSVARPHR